MSKNIILIFIVLCFCLPLPAQNDDLEHLNSAQIENFEGLLDLDFTQAERDSMIDGLEYLKTQYVKIHEFQLNNSVPPALVFNPLPPGWLCPVSESQFLTSDYSKTRMPADINDLSFYSVGELSELIRTGKLSSVELTRLCIDRLKKYGPVLECVITLTEELAMNQAEKADREIAAGKYRGMLHGIPYGIKDLFSAKGYKTTWGAAPYKDQVIDMNATVVQKLEDAGAVLVAKLTMGALAWGDRWYGGKTRNPWDTTRGSSGSSAGSAAAVSAGLVPFAIGTETWGSIVSPCTECGATGLRPTFGRVSRNGAMALSWSMDKIGPICRTVEDCAIVLQAIKGPDNIDPSVLDFPFSYNHKINLKNIRIGYVDDFNGDYPFKTNDSLAIVKLKELGAQLVPIQYPDIPFKSLSLILNAEASAAFDKLTRSNRDDLLVRQIKNAWPNVFRQSRFIPAVEYINANRIRFLLIEAMNKIMKDIDLYIAPSWEGNNLLVTNLTGHPCLVLPTGFYEGRPTSITFNGKLFDEGTILAVAKCFQDATLFHKKHPEYK